MRISKVTTKTGDAGETGLGDGRRVSKADPRIECLGALDELNSFIGYAKVAVSNGEIIGMLESVQQNLFNMGGGLSMPGRNISTINDNQIVELEKLIDAWNSDLPPLKEFILPGGNEASARIHLARVMTRKTERKFVALHQSKKLPAEWLQYLNRLSDVFFVLARKLQSEEGVDEKQWKHE